ncbi:MAG: hypothetical protein CME71_09590 [Halobacteriovorax sp.]|nr:hypothetical protein [Halobacteriovorax sp.]
MYKLVVIGGKLRGKEYELEEGENTLGRDPECSVHFPVQGVSKKHMSITVTSDVAYIKDLGSSNGTFLNGKIVKRGTVKSGDKIALPDSILQVVYVKEKKKVVKRKSAKMVDQEEEFYSGGAAPENLPGKLKHFFKYKLMNILHGINEEYEWRVLLGILLTIFSVLAITLTIFPVLQDSKSILLYETSQRGAFYADVISRTNSRALEQKELDRVDSSFLENEDGVKSYELFDMEGRIVRPIAQLNKYINDSFSVEAFDWAKKTKDDGGGSVLKKLLADGEIGIGKKIMAYDMRVGRLIAVGVIAIRFQPKSLAVEATKSSKAYLESLTTTGLVAIFFFGFVYYLTIRPIEEMRFQIEEALRGKRKGLDSSYLMEELGPLRNSINSLLQRIRELNKEDDGDFEEMESDEGYVNSLGEFLRGAGVPALVLDSQKNVTRINLEAEDLTGIRESTAQGMSLLDVSREKGFAATVIELCDNSANNTGTNQSGEYELGGIPYEVHVVSMVGKDGFAKAFYVTFLKDG